MITLAPPAGCWQRLWNERCACIDCDPGEVPARSYTPPPSHHNRFPQPVGETPQKLAPLTGRGGRTPTRCGEMAGVQRGWVYRSERVLLRPHAWPMHDYRRSGKLLSAATPACRSLLCASSPTGTWQLRWLRWAV